MPKDQAQQIAIQRAIESLQNIDIVKRAQMLSLGTVQGDLINFKAFGQNLVLNANSLEIVYSDTHKPAKPGDVILILHYLMCDLPVQPTDELITFRDFPGGQFYLNPFLSRTVNPLKAKIGNDIELLKKHLAKFDYKTGNLGDFSAKIHAFGQLELTLIYYMGDNEFPANIEVFFDSSIKRVFQAEDAAVMASRICIGLLFP